MYYKDNAIFSEDATLLVIFDGILDDEIVLAFTDEQKQTFMELNGYTKVDVSDSKSQYQEVDNYDHYIAWTNP